MRRSVGSTIVVMALAAACSGGGDDPAAPTDPTPPTSAAPTSTEAAEPTSTTSTTSAVTTAPPATSPPDSSAVSTSDVPVGSVEDEIRAAYEVIYQGYWSCLRAPLACDLSWLVEGSEAAVAMQATMQGLADRDRYVGDDDVGYYVIEEVTVAEDGRTATVVSCWWSTAVLYGAPVDPNRPVGPDNPATVVNNTPGSFRQADILATGSRGAWLVQSSEITDTTARTDQCAG